ncbi:MAG: glutamate-1-semialdehyde 2,1-aminomutase [Syntrophomonadaceae bacterium]|nr:glutamate-1-semialdehyde 2,1-aminomutase [Syntrophomonadaceae bacterium]
MAAGNISRRLFARARELMPGGVNSPVRAFRAVNQEPLFIARGEGARVADVDGRWFLDYVCSWGPLILGHAHPAVVEAVAAAAAAGTSYGAPCEREVELAELVRQAFPGMARLRMVNSGTEATMSAIRLARAFTGRDRVVKFEGCYHGHADGFLVRAGSGLLTGGVPTSPGVPAAVLQHTLVARYNDLDSVRTLFEACGEEIAAVIVEPVAGNMGLVLPAPGFLAGLREITRRHGALLVFDEVITGFRLCFGGYQHLAGVEPDLTCLGKIIGGGLPVGAYGGREEIMALVAPEGPVYQAGTLSGNPVAMAAGVATLRQLASGEVYQTLEALGARLEQGLRQALAERGSPATLNRLGSMFCCFFAPEPVADYAGALRADTAGYARFFAAMLERGVYLPPSQFEVCFISGRHTPADIDATVEAFAASLPARQG